ncbi:MAG TPA: hypothetical protein VKZ58_11490 [Longimicrobiales bacterium]|nr:hypothetical protein [Longimicrobiales bacterium]
MITVSAAVPPALLALQTNVVPSVSLVSVVAAQPCDSVMSDSSSVAVQLTVTSLVYQPRLPSVPVMVAVMSGGVSSLGTSLSKAPMSQFPPFGRRMPR